MYVKSKISEKNESTRIQSKVIKNLLEKMQGKVKALGENIGEIAEEVKELAKEKIQEIFSKKEQQETIEAKRMDSKIAIKEGAFKSFFYSVATKEAMEEKTKSRIAKFFQRIKERDLYLPNEYAKTVIERYNGLNIYTSRPEEITKRKGERNVKYTEYHNIQDYILAYNEKMKKCKEKEMEEALKVQKKAERKEEKAKKWKHTKQKVISYISYKKITGIFSPKTIKKVEKKEGIISYQQASQEFRKSCKTKEIEEKIIQTKEIGETATKGKKVVSARFNNGKMNKEKIEEEVKG